MFPKILATLAVSASLSLTVAAQKVDLDKFNFNIEYLNLPVHYLAPEQRSYSTFVTFSPMAQSVMSEEEAANRLSITNFSRKQEGGAVQIRLDIGNTVFNRSELKTRTEEIKDKSGKVTGRNYYYYVYASYTNNGKYSITGPKNPYKSLKKSKKEESKEENPFLKDAGIASTTAAADQQTVTFSPGRLYELYFSRIPQQR